MSTLTSRDHISPQMSATTGKKNNNRLLNMSFDLDVLSVLGRCEGIPGGRVRLAREKRRTTVSKVDGGDAAANNDNNDDDDDDKRLVVVKTYDLEEVRDQSNFYDLAECIANEAVMMRQFQHPNLLPFLGSYVSGSEVVVVVPHMVFGSVRDLLDSHYPEGLPETAIAFVVRDVLQALQYLHAKGIVHRGVRASHILLSDSGQARLTGLRYSCSLMHSGHGLQDRYDYPLHVAKTNLNWLSPEFLQQSLLGYNERTDIYSLGVTICEAANGMVPFSEMPATLMLLEKLRGAAPKLIDCTTIPLPQDQAFSSDMPADSGVGASVGSCSNMALKDSVYARRNFSDGIHDLVELCCQLDAGSRPTAATLLGHAFVKQLRKTTMTMASMLDSIKAAVVTTSKDGAGDNQEEAVQELQKMSLDGEWDF